MTIAIDGQRSRTFFFRLPQGTFPAISQIILNENHPAFTFQVVITPPFSQFNDVLFISHQNSLLQSKTNVTTLMRHHAAH
jgi:hypothetical protein